MKDGRRDSGSSLELTRLPLLTEVVSSTVKMDDDSSSSWDDSEESRLPESDCAGEKSLMMQAVLGSSK